MEIINLTPHTLNIHTGNDTVVTIEKHGTPAARVSTSRTPSRVVNGIPTFHVEFGEVENLPAPQEGCIFIVSGMVAAAAPREDIFSPGELVRDEAGRPIGCLGLTTSTKGGK